MGRVSFFFKGFLRVFGLSVCVMEEKKEEGEVVGEVWVQEEGTKGDNERERERFLWLLSCDALFGKRMKR